MEKTKIFISYNHQDTALISPIVQLLRVNQSFVFLDVDGIRPGKRWRSEISKALDESNMIVLFWCGHASESKEVEKEWRLGIEKNKDILPLILDKTPLPDELSHYQWIDFIDIALPTHKSCNGILDKILRQQNKLKNLAVWALVPVSLILIWYFVTLPTMYGVLGHEFICDRNPDLLQCHNPPWLLSSIALYTAALLIMNFALQFSLHVFKRVKEKITFFVNRPGFENIQKEIAANVDEVLVSRKKY